MGIGYSFVWDKCVVNMEHYDDDPMGFKVNII